MGIARTLLCALLALGSSCHALRRGEHLVLEWPRAVAPAGATDVRYEVAVWAREGEVPTQRLVHRDGVTGNALRVDASGWPRDICWSVRAHWLENGRRRCSRWLAADGGSVTAALVPSRELRAN
jgi:hypothetical protein